MGKSEFDGDIKIGIFGDVQQKMRSGLGFGTVEGWVVPNADSASFVCLLHITEGPIPGVLSEAMRSFDDLISLLGLKCRVIMLSIHIQESVPRTCLL